MITCLAAVVGCERPPDRADHPVEVPISLVNNLAIASVRINGSTPLSFVVDTGAAATVVHTETARALGLQLGLSGHASTGGGAVAASDLGEVTVSMGDVRLPRVAAIAIDLSGLHAGLGQRVDGILGFELFDRHVVTLDYEANLLHARAPEAFSPAPGGVHIPLRLQDRVPFTSVRLLSDDDRWVDADVEFDTGQTGALTVHRPFVERVRLFAGGHPAADITTGAIIAGGISAQVTRIAAVRVGAIQLAGPIATVTPTSDAAGVPSTVAGILGGEILRRFRVAVDYRGRRAILEPTGTASAPFTFDASGMSLAARRLDPPEYSVRSLVAGSPAMEAGIQVGDVITALGGHPAARLRLSEVREQLREPGRTMHITFSRQGTERTVTLVTRRLV